MSELPELPEDYTFFVGRAPNGTDWWWTPEAAEAHPDDLEHWRELVRTLTRPPGALGQTLLEASRHQSYEDWREEHERVNAPHDPPSPFDW